MGAAEIWLVAYETRRFMRMLVFFDLPVTGPDDKRNYLLFRRFLLQDGYQMLQWSVYSRIVAGFEQRETHLKRLRANLPPAGSVRCLAITEKQFTGIQFLVSPQKPAEMASSADQLFLF